MGGNIDNFQITGALIDAVIAASVAPEGGDGNLALACSDVPGDGTYDAPAGTLTAPDGQKIPHFTPGSYDEFGRLIGYEYDTALDPVIDDCILPGAINPSFAPPTPPAGEPIGLPTKSTVLGGVIKAPCKVVWTVDEPRRSGWAYGTLPGHPECGEEAFVVERTGDGTVWLTVNAFSRPARWYARAGGAATRGLQHAYARRCGKVLRDLCEA